MKRSRTILTSYTPSKVSRLLYDQMNEKPSMKTLKISRLVISICIYIRHPSTTAREQLEISGFNQELSNCSREVSRAHGAVSGGLYDRFSSFCELINVYVHRAKLIMLYYMKMRKISVRAAEHILKQLKKDGVIPAREI